MIRPETLPQSPYGSSHYPHQLLEEAGNFRPLNVSPTTTIGYTILNEHLMREVSPVVSIGGIASDILPDRAYEGAQLAALCRPIIMLDMPGQGLSTAHKRRQIFDLTIKRDTASQAAPLVDAVQKLAGSDPVDFFGISHGGHLALKCTELSNGDLVSNVLAIDLPAVQRRFTVPLQIGYMFIDGYLGKRKYLESLQGSELEEDFNRFKEEFLALHEERGSVLFKNNPGLMALNFFMSANARAGSLRSWQRILDRKSTYVTVVTGEKSSITNPHAINEFIAEQSPAGQARSRQIVIEGEDHNIGLIHLMPRAVAWAKAAYSHTL